MPQVLPTAADQNTEYEDFYESSLDAPAADTDTDIFVTDLPQSSHGFLVIDPLGTNPEIIFYNSVGANFVRCPSATDGQGRGVFQTTPRSWDSGTKIGMYSMAAFFEGIVTGKFMRDGFLQSRHFSGSIDINSWIGAGETWQFGSNNGSKEATYTITGVDRRNKYTKGMKVRLPRVTAMPAQSMGFIAADNQYATKASPSGITFTGPFTCEAWIYLNSYTGQEMDIINRRNVTFNGGWGLVISGSGRLQIFYGSGANSTNFTTYQSIPLKRWVHVAGVVTSVSGKTGIVYIDGIPVPVTSTLSSATTLIQPAEDLRIGAISGGTPTNTYFDGYMSEVRVWSVAQSQANIQTNMGISLTGAETNLVALYRGDGDFTDLTTNANNLTASGSPVATANNTIVPYAANQYGYITKVDYLSGNTVMTVFTGTDNVAPMENLTDVSYSTVASPVGFPSSREKWKVDALVYSGFNIAVSSLSTWYNPGGFYIPVPTGDWLATYNIDAIHTTSGPASFVGGLWTLSTANNAESDPRLTKYTQESNASKTQNNSPAILTSGEISNDALDNHYLNTQPSAISGSSSAYIGERSDVTCYLAYV